LTIVSSAHFDVDYNNAFWNGEQMVYGDGDGMIFSPLTQGLDVIAHELTHGVTQYTAGLVYEDEQGALNESMSDVMGMFAQASATGTIDSQIGEDVYTPSIANDALRDMADPHKGSDYFTYAYNCNYRVAQPGYCGQPAHMNEYAHYPLSLSVSSSDQGGVHTNSGIPSKAAWLLSQGGSAAGISVVGIGRIKAQQIYYRMLTLYLTPYSNFLAARNSAIQACTDLIGQFGITANDCAQVRAAFAAVGVGKNTVATPTHDHSK
jgi:bacillolysin